MEEKIVSHRSGFVAIVGKPNTGKSTLMNALLKQNVAAVSLRPQTTRKRQLGILTGEDFQIVFVDTPGLHKPDFKLSQFINSEALSALHDADVILFLLDGSVLPDKQDETLAMEIRKLMKKVPVVLAITKSDRLNQAARSVIMQQYASLTEGDQVLEISALKSIDLDKLVQRIVQELPEGPQYFPPDQVTDQYERQIAADMIRASCLHYLEDEVPHSIAVRVDEYIERDAQTNYIMATIVVDREVHKGIVIGKGGEMLKKIGTRARQEIEEMSESKVFLELKVRVEKNWRNNPHMLKQLGYTDSGSAK